MICPGCHQSTTSGGPYCAACAAVILPPDTTLHFRYRVDRLIGRGGFGLTYQALDVSTGDLLAVKEFFPPGAARSGRTVIPSAALRQDALEAQRERFLTTMQAAATLQHRNLIPVLSVFAQNGTAYAVMPLLRGLTLQRRVEQLGPVPGPEVTRIGHELAQAVNELHTQGFVHRDLTPSNAFLCEDGRVVLLDFDSLVVDGAPQSRLVSPGYSPIEQYAQSAVPTPASDVYALGATLYFAVTGDTPPEATALATGAQHLRPFPPSVTATLSAAITGALTVRAAERTATAAAFLRQLETPQAAAPERPAHQFETIRAHHGAVMALAWDGEGQVLSGAGDHAVKVWRLADLRASAQPQYTFQDHHGAVQAAVHHPELGWVTGGEDGRVVIRQRGERYPRHIDGPEAVVAVSTAGGAVAIVTMARTVQLWNAADGRGGDSPRLAHWPTCLQGTHRGEALFVGLQDGRIAILNAVSAQLMAERQAHTGPVTALAALPGATLSAGEDGRVRVWSDHGNLLADIHVGARPLTTMATDESSEFVYVTDQSGTLFAVDTGDFSVHQVRVIPGEPTALMVCGHTVVAGLGDGRLMVFPLHSRPSA